MTCSEVYGCGYVMCRGVAMWCAGVWLCDVQGCGYVMCRGVMFMGVAMWCLWVCSIEVTGRLSDVTWLLWQRCGDIWAPGAMGGASAVLHSNRSQSQSQASYPEAAGYTCHAYSLVSYGGCYTGTHNLVCQLSWQLSFVQCLVFKYSCDCQYLILWVTMTTSSCHGNYHLFNVSCLSILVNVSIWCELLWRPELSWHQIVLLLTELIVLAILGGRAKWARHLQG